MGKVIRIEDDSIRSMRKTLDDLPDKRLGKTRDEATAMLFENLKKAMERLERFVKKLRAEKK